jgi:universal stress protein A
MLVISAPHNILVPIDFSERTEHALDYACMLAEKLGATVHLVHAIGAALPELSVALTEEMLETLRRDATAGLEKLAEPRRPRVAFGQLLIHPGDPRDAILEAAESLRPDLIVIGSHGRRGVSRALLGSVAEDVVRRAPCPVLVVRAPKTSGG